jgi:hypothetical protein
MVFTNTAAKIALLFLVLGMNCWGPGGGKNNLPRKVAREYGVGSFHRIDQIKYTFNVTFNGKTMSRSWLWDVGMGRVTLSKPGAQPFSYKRNGMPDTTLPGVGKADAEFINDQYWLLFPLHLAWDATALLTVIENRPLPIGGGVATCITVTYPKTGGYTPGDAFDLFIDKQNKVLQWTYRHGNVTVPTRTSRWEDNRTVGPLLVSLSRPGADSTFRVWFTDVAVQLKGSDTWIAPK